MIRKHGRRLFTINGVDEVQFYDGTKIKLNPEKAQSMFYSTRHKERVNVMRAKTTIKWLFILASILAAIYVVLVVNAIIVVGK